MPVYAFKRKKVTWLVDPAEIVGFDWEFSTSPQKQDSFLACQQILDYCQHGKKERKKERKKGGRKDSKKEEWNR